MVSVILCRKIQLIPITNRASRPKQTQHSVPYHMVKTFSPCSHHWDLCPSNFQRQTSLLVSRVSCIKFKPIPITEWASRTPWVPYHMVKTFSLGSHHWDRCPSKFQRQTSLLVSGVPCIKFEPIPITEWASRTPWVPYHMVKTFSLGSHHWD